MSDEAKPTALTAVTLVRTLLAGRPGFMAGSAPTAAFGGSQAQERAYDDVDVFFPNPMALSFGVSTLLHNSFVPSDEKQGRILERWLDMGIKSFHTNSLKLSDPNTGIEVNSIFKTIDGHPATSLAQVVEGFDFGFLTHGIDLKTNQYRDMAGFFFADLDVTDPRPMFPRRRDDWRNGFINRYQGIRVVGRYAKYHNYGYDVSAIKDDLVQGYFMAAQYYTNRFDQEEIMLGQIFESLAMHIEQDDIERLREFSREVDFKDDLDAIYEQLT